MLQLKDGSQVSGRLTSCDEEHCVVDKRRVPLADIAVIELRGGVKAPPDAPAGAVVLTNGTIHEGEFVSLNLGVVETDAGDVDRAEVALIVLEATVAPPSGGGTAQEAPQPPVEPPVQPPQPPTQPPPSQPQPPPPQPQPTPAPQQQQGTRGALWSGTIRARLWGTVDGAYSNLRVNIRVRLREYRRPWVDLTGKPIGTVRDLRSEGSEIHNDYRCSASGGSCSGQGSVTVHVRPEDAEASVIYHQTRAGPTGLDLPVGREMYVIGIPPPADATYDVTYRNVGGTNLEPTDFMSPVIGWHPVLPRVPMTDPQLRFVEGGRMTGSFMSDAVGAFRRIAVSWTICREGVQCSEPPPLPEGAEEEGSTPPAEDDDCAELAQLTSAMRALKETFEGFEDDYKKAIAERDAVRDGIWGLDGALRKYFTSMLGLAGQGASGALAKAISLAKTLLGMSGEGDTGDVIKATKALATDPLKDAAAAAAVRAAVQQADAYLAQTGDHAGALRTYAAAIGKSEKLKDAGSKVAKGVNFASAVADYAEKTNSLFDLIQEWLDHDEEANRAKTQMDDINRRMDELQRRIDACRRTGVVTRSDVQLAAFYAAATAGSGDPASIQARLAATRTRLEAVPSQLEAAAPWLLPFFADAPMSPGLAAALLEKALPHLESVKQTIDEAVAEGQSMEMDLQQAIPQKPGAGKGGAATATLR